MSGQPVIKRHIVCVDDNSDSAVAANDGSEPHNCTNIKRIRNFIRQGNFQNESGASIDQGVYYYDVTKTTSSKFSFKATNHPLESLIQNIAYETCKNLESPNDEIWFFGAGRGAYVVRAVAGVLHEMKIPRPGNLDKFPELYKNTLDLIRAKNEDDSRKGGKALEFIRTYTQGQPNICFVGLFDTSQANDRDLSREPHELQVVSSIKHWRHALAFNETRKPFAVDAPANSSTKETQTRSLIQAWFLGDHQDMLGGGRQDGLSLYPLQWMIIEAMMQGLLLLSGDSKSDESSLALIFPQYAGALPDLYGDEKIKWKIQYANGISLLMYDLHSVHIKKLNEDVTHAIQFKEGSSRIPGTSRKIFDKTGLLGYNADEPTGTVIHPSVFCILDRNQKFLEQKRFKSHKQALANFEADCLRIDSGALPPWLQESQLLSSGVKAFRILVCGKTGVGKSTLINKVFGVEMTEESKTYAQGNHDIDQAFESPNHPGLLIHDSRGWQAGSDRELDLIAQFLRHRAFQKEAAEALHVIWFCVDSDVSRIEEADKRTFETIAKFSNHVPVLVVGTKKDKLVGFRKMQLLEQYMAKSNDYQESIRLANIEADRAATEQFMALRDQLSQIKSYKADGYICLSKDDDDGVKGLISQTLDMIVDERVRIFCVAAQVVDVNQKIDSAITECMRLGAHAVRTAMVPLPFSGMIGTPTVSRIICEHVLQCFGFPKAMPEEVEAIMSRIVLTNMRQFMTVSLTQFLVVSGAAIGLAVGTAGIGAVLGLASSFLSTPPTARMLLKVSCDMILILERSFRYNGKYVSIKQIEDAARQYTTIMTTTFGGKEIRTQQHISDEIDRLIPLKDLRVSFKFGGLRASFEQIIYKNRFDRPPEYEDNNPLSEKLAELAASVSVPVELGSNEGERRAELMGGTTRVAELDGAYSRPPMPNIPELPGSEPLSAPSTQQSSGVSTFLSPTTTDRTSSTNTVGLSTVSSMDYKSEKSKSDGSSFFSRMSKSMKIKKTKSEG